MSGKKDYYSILGLSSTATKEEIKKKYIQLTKKYHPDVYSGPKEEAEEKYKDILEAYSVLSNEKKKKEYDSGAMDYSPEGGQYSSSFFDSSPFEKLFQNFKVEEFGGEGFSGNKVSKSQETKEIFIEVPLEKIYLGEQIKIQYSRQELCRNCDNRSKICSACKGEGFKKRTSFFSIFETKSVCFKCRGSGTTGEMEYCSTCKGKAFFLNSTVLKVYLPKGVQAEEKFIIANEGNEIYPGAYTDLELTVSFPKKEKGLYKDQNDLVLVCSFPYLSFVNQEIKKVNVFSTELELDLSTCIFSEKYGFCIIIKSKGFFLKNGKKGDFVARLHPVF